MRARVPASWLPSRSTRQRSSGFRSALLTSVGVQRTAFSPRRIEMLPPLPSTYDRCQSFRPTAMISALAVSASGEAKSRAWAADAAGGAPARGRRGRLAVAAHGAAVAAHGVARGRRDDRARAERQPRSRPRAPRPRRPSPRRPAEPRDRWSSSAVLPRSPLARRLGSRPRRRAERSTRRPGPCPASRGSRPRGPRRSRSSARAPGSRWSATTSALPPPWPLPAARFAAVTGSTIRSRVPDELRHRRVEHHVPAHDAEPHRPRLRARPRRRCRRPRAAPGRCRPGACGARRRRSRRAPSSRGARRGGRGPRPARRSARPSASSRCATRKRQPSSVSCLRVAVSVPSMRARYMSDDPQRAARWRSAARA